jgi:hypothetical protein
MQDITERLVIEVPKQIAVLKAKGGPDAADIERAKKVNSRISKEGRALVFGIDGAKAEELFTELVFGLAVSAFNKGGSTLCGVKWEAKA